jgi:C-terminal processing protease CtpA/Prc
MSSEAHSATIQPRPSENDKSEKAFAGQFDASQYDSALIAKWWNIRHSDGGVSQSAEPISQANGSDGVGAAKTADEGSIGAWSDGKPRIEHDGVKIDRLAPNGPADEAGVQVGDYILALNGIYVFTVEELTENMRRCRLGAKVQLRYRRRSTIYDTFIVIGSESVLRAQPLLKATQ